MNRIFGLAGWSGSGKTTLMEKLIPAIVARGFRVSTVKHAHHTFDIDTPGKDSHRHRSAGATEVMIGSSRRWALIHELRDTPEPSLDSLLTKLTPVDIVLVEGFKRYPHAKLEIHRSANGKPWLHPDDPGVVAVASDTAPPADLPHFHLDDVDAIAAFVLAHVGLMPFPDGR